MSGYYGGWIDGAIQRLMEFIRSIPTIPLWMGLAAALPIAWDPLFVYVLITIILSLIGWTHLARVVRGRFFSLKTEDYVLAARLAGASEYRIVTRHMLPAMTSYIIAAVTLAIPEMILGETALSFLGLGLRPPVVSWGVLLQDAQNLRTISWPPGFWPRVWRSCSLSSPSTSLATACAMPLILTATEGRSHHVFQAESPKARSRPHAARAAAGAGQCRRAFPHP
ncbi:ABC transporter permease [Pannonibacter sp. Pt2-lr]